jgi:hypothetical protein
VFSQAELYCVTFAAGFGEFPDPAKKARIGKFPETGALKVRGYMDHPFQHPSGKDLLKRVGQLFHSENAYILRDSNVVFVCGGPTNVSSMRQRFIEFGRTELTHLRFFLAEDAEKDYVSNTEVDLHNVAEFEEIIGHISDCLIIFPESPGSFAELGYFSKNTELSKKILVVNNADLQGQDSFIRRGPIHLIDKVSKFRHEIQITYGENANFTLVKERLEARIVGKKRKRFAITQYSDLTFRDKFFAIFEIVRFFEVMIFEEIEYAFRSIFGNVKTSDLTQLLSILVAADLVRRGGKDEMFFCINRDARPFMEFDGFNEVAFRLEVTDFYVTSFPEIAKVAGELSL